MKDHSPIDLSGLVKAYDVRGIVPDQLDGRRSGHEACHQDQRRAQPQYDVSYLATLARPPGGILQVACR